MNDAKRSDGLVGDIGTNGNGKAAPARFVEIHLRLNLGTGAFEARVVPEAAVHDRHMMYGLIEMMRDVVYRHQLPGELAVLAESQAKQIVVAPEGSLPPFPGRG